ncbi:MAG: hypothetical protein IPP16_07200 [Acidimicrobiaceae bacterium]|nr:hypothetical protein [Acidimicrobiaceae bacterium]
MVTPPPPDASFTLWASGDATTPWLMLQVARDRPPFVFTDSSRRLAGGFELVSRRGQLSTTDVVIDIGGRWTASIRAFGIDDDALTRFASGLQLVDGLVVVDDAVTEQLGLSVTHTDQWAAQLLYGTVTSEMRSLTAQGTTITLRAARVRSTSAARCCLSSPPAWWVAPTATPPAPWWPPVKPS